MAEELNEFASDRGSLTEVRDLASRHDWLSRHAPDRRQYALDTADYMPASINALSRPMIKSCLDRRVKKNNLPVTDAVMTIADDDALVADCYEVVRESVIEEALSSMGKVFAEHLPPAWTPVPIASDSTLRIGAEDDVPHRIDALLSDAQGEKRARGPDRFMAHCVHIARVVYAADRAFKAAAIVLMSVDVEDEIAGLMCNEVMADIA